MPLDLVDNPSPGYCPCRSRKAERRHGNLRQVQCTKFIGYDKDARVARKSKAHFKGHFDRGQRTTRRRKGFIRAGVRVCAHHARQYDGIAPGRSVRRGQTHLQHAKLKQKGLSDA